jgi:hypothetical protein
MIFADIVSAWKGRSAEREVFGRFFIASNEKAFCLACKKTDKQ